MPFAGVDYPEAVTDALHELLNLSWRATATKICVFIADAPPHGLGGSGGDNFPDGNARFSALGLLVRTPIKSQIL